MRKLFPYVMVAAGILVASIMAFSVSKTVRKMEAVVEETSGPKAEHALETRFYPREDGLVTLTPPYPGGEDGNTGRISLALALRAVCAQAGLKYDAETSRVHTEPTFRYNPVPADGGASPSEEAKLRDAQRQYYASTYKLYLFPEFENITWDEAMSRLLSPYNLIYVIEGATVALRRPESCCKGKETPVRLRPPYTLWKRFKDEPPERTTIKRAVQLICEQAGLMLDWPNTYRNIGPLSKMYSYPDLEDITWDEAMREILSPRDLDYTIKDDMVTLYSTKYGNREPDSIALVTLKEPYAEWARKPDGRRYKLTLKDAVWAVSLQAGMNSVRYDGDRNIKNLLRRAIHPGIDGVTWEEAMEELLAPFGLTYIIDDDGPLIRRAGKTGLGKDSLVTLTPPYTGWRPKSIQDPKRPKISLGGGVGAICDQAGFRHSWARSVENTGGISKKFIYPDFEDVTWEEGMKLLLDPHGLAYVAEGSLILLVMADGRKPPDARSSTGPSRRRTSQPDTKRPVTLKPPYADKDGPRGKITLLYSVKLICRQAGMKLDWKQSAANTEPLGRSYVDPDFEDVPWEEAMEQVLDPLGLAYIVENGKVVLTGK